MTRPLFVTLALLGCIPISQAALISADSHFGTDSLTLDTATGLAWLDPDQSLFWSYNEVQAELGSGGHFEGFRYASTAEVSTLFFDSAGIDPAAPDGGYAASIGLMDRLGDTFSDGSGPGTFQATTAFFDDGDSGQLGLASLERLDYDATRTDGVFDGFVATDSSWGPDTSDIFGSWLVRTTAVDEPAALALLGLGLAVVLLRRRYHWPAMGSTGLAA